MYGRAGSISFHIPTLKSLENNFACDSTGSANVKDQFLENTRGCVLLALGKGKAAVPNDRLWLFFPPLP